MSDLDDVKARRKQLRAVGFSDMEANRQAVSEAAQRRHEREETWHDPCWVSPARHNTPTSGVQLTHSDAEL